MVPCARPRFIVTMLVISGVMLAAIPLLHRIGPSLLLEGQQAEYHPTFHSARRHKADKHAIKAHRNARHVNKYSDLDDSELPVSLSRDIDTRSSFQKAQVKKYCEKYDNPDALPNNHTLVNEAWKHLILDKERKILFCLAPKLASTNIRLLFAALNNVVDPSTVMDRYNHSRDLQAFRYRFSTVSEAEKEKTLATYFKFVMTRNPLERILSAYRNKFENHPINPEVTGVFDNAKIEMIKTYRPKLYAQWEESGRTIKVFPTFNEFIRYLDSHSYYELDPHFRPLQYICHPCVFHYDFYANLKLMPEEFDGLFKKFNIPNDSFRNQPAHHDTGSLVPEYYAKLSKTEKKMVQKFVYQELEFYYHIYPEEMDMHIPLIGQFE